MDIMDFIRQQTRHMNGVNIGGDIAYSYDDEHAAKVAELVKEDSRYLYAIQIKCGIDPFSEEYYGHSDSDITIANVDYFAIRETAKSRIDELRKEVYDNIDWVYSNRQEALNELLGEEDPFDMDWDMSDEL